MPPQDGVGEEVLKMSTEEIVQRTRLLDSEIKVAAGAAPRRAGPGSGAEPGRAALPWELCAAGVRGGRVSTATGTAKN